MFRYLPKYYSQKVQPCSCKGNIESPGVIEKANALMLVGSDTGEHNEVLLSALEGVHTGYLNVLAHMYTRDVLEAGYGHIMTVTTALGTLNYQTLCWRADLYNLLIIYKLYIIQAPQAIFHNTLLPKCTNYILSYNMNVYQANVSHIFTNLKASFLQTLGHSAL